MNNAIFDYLIKDEEERFAGWDFAYLTKSNRMSEFPLTWNYNIEILPYLLNCKNLLDMGTGGGEFLSTLPFPRNTCATEGYSPNITIAKNRLEPLGIKVYGIENDDFLPFNDQQFDLIINRHESYSPKEVKRILKTEGIFITQQVGGQNDKELNTLFETEESIYSPWNLEKALKDLKDENFDILKQKEIITKMRFYDIGAIIYYLKAIPWQIPDFSVTKYKNQLIKIHSMIEDTGYIDVSCHRFLIISKK